LVRENPTMLAGVGLSIGAGSKPTLGVTHRLYAAGIERIVAGWNRREPFTGFEGLPICTYRVVAADEVADDARHAAAAATALATLELGVDAPQLAWFREERELEAAHRAAYGTVDWLSFEHPSVRGLSSCLQRVIAVDATMSPPEIVETTAHEIFHLQQRPVGDYLTLERPANRYGAAVRDALVSTCRGREIVAPTVHVTDGFSHKTMWAGTTETGGVVIAHFGDRDVVVYKNLGSRRSPRWFMGVVA
jgi:hypothetical protein